MLADFDAGVVALMPPTWAVLRDIARYRTVAALQEGPRVFERIEPTLIAEPDGVRIVFDGVEDWSRQR